MHETTSYRDLITDVAAILERYRPTIYYGATDTIARGVFYELKDPVDGIAALVLHPDDLKELQRISPEIRFIPLRDKPPPSHEQLISYLNRA